MTDRSNVAVAALESELESLAVEAIARLDIGGAIEQLHTTLFQQLEKCDAVAASSNAFFLASSLPMANALIHYATSEHHLEDARNWARANWSEAQDPTSMLAALTLVYIVDLGRKEFANDSERRDTWERIHGRIQSILEAELQAA